MKSRPLYVKAWQDLAAEKAMIFLAGPRQSGKTTRAQMISERFVNRLYVNWDNPEDRIRLLEHPFFFQEIERHDRTAPRKPPIGVCPILTLNNWSGKTSGI